MTETDHGSGKGSGEGNGDIKEYGWGYGIATGEGIRNSCGLGAGNGLVYCTDSGVGHTGYGLYYLKGRGEGDGWACGRGKADGTGGDRPKDTHNKKQSSDEQ